MIKHGKNTTIMTNTYTVKKTYISETEFHREIMGIMCMLKANSPHMIPVLRINFPEKSILYERGLPVMDGVHNDATLTLLLSAGSVILDDLHKRNLVHGDFWLGNLVYRIRDSRTGDSRTGDLAMIDFETTVYTTDDALKAKDIFDYLDNLQLYFKSERQLSLLKNIKDTIADTREEETRIRGRLRTMTYYIIKPGVIGNLYEIILALMSLKKQ